METETEKAERITVTEARKLAKYYGKMAQKDNSIDTWEALSYCRGIILKYGRK